MLLKLISTQDIEYLLDIAELLSISDKPLLWDGKIKEEITSKSDITEISIQKGEKELSILSDLKSEGKIKNYSSFGIFTLQNIEKKLLEKIKNIPLHKIEDPGVRADAALAILRELLKDKKPENPSAPKVMLFELMLVALADGNISSIKWQILNEFKNHYRLDDYIFNDLLERAETSHREINKTISIILE